MPKTSFSQRRLWWVAAAILIVVLAACVAQIPVVTPDSPAATETSSDEENTSAGASTEVTATEATSDTTAAETEESTVEATGAQTETATSSDGSASVTVEGEEASATSEISPTATIDLIGGAPLPSEETYKGLPVGFTEGGLAYRGDPDAPIVMVEFSDFACPFCNRHFVQTDPALDESFVRTGQVRVVFHDMPLESLHPNAPAAHEASLCVAAQDSATDYWNYHAALFRSVEEWESATDPLPIFARLAEENGVDVAVYEACMTSGEMKSIVQQRVDEAFARGFSATPSFQIIRGDDGAVFELIGAQPYEQFAATVDSAVAGEMPSVAQEPEAQPEQEGIPFWATAEGWQPDPDRPGFNMAGDQYRGEIDAPVTVIEFSDFQCPFCQRHNIETQPELDEKYVDSGKVLWVYKHFPLDIHPQAPAAGVAAECAAEQGKFWEMHAALFTSSDQWAINDPNEVFKTIAADVGLDAEAFASCLTDPAVLERVNSDMGEGVQFVQGTPTFIIVHGSEGSIIPGALPEATFSQVLDEQLAAAEGAQE